MNIPCTFRKFSFINEEYYGCIVSNEDLTVFHQKTFAGRHNISKTNFSVTGIWFENCNMTQVPQEITKEFPNLTIIAITKSKLKMIRKNDMIEYKSLTKFICTGNELKFLPGDLFEDFKNLDCVDFSDNMLGVIEPNIFNALDSLRNVYLANNPDYGQSNPGMTTYMWSFFNKDAYLNKVKQELFDNFPSRLSFLEDLRKSESKFETKNQQLNLDIESVKNNMEVQKKNYASSVLLQQNLYSDIRRFIEDDANKDLSINIIDQKFQVHKLIIAIRSPTFARVLRDVPDIDNLNLTDVSADIFEKILKFIYKNEMPRDYDTDFVQLLIAAGRFEIKQLVSFAAPKVLPLIDNDNALEILSTCMKHDLNELKHKAFNVMQKKYPKLGIRNELITNTDKLMEIVKVLKEKENANQKCDEQLNDLLK